MLIAFGVISVVIFVVSAVILFIGYHEGDFDMKYLDEGIRLKHLAVPPWLLAYLLVEYVVIVVGDIDTSKSTWNTIIWSKKDSGDGKE